MAAEGGPHLAVVVVEQAGAALVVGVGLRLAPEHRHRPPLGPGQHRLRVPVGPLHQADGDGPGPGRREGDQVGQVVAGVLEVGLDHHAGVEVGELGLLQQLPEQLEGEVLDVVVLGVEVHEGAAGHRLAEDGPQPGLGLVEPLGPGEGRVAGRQGGGLDAHVHPRQGAEVVELEEVVGRPVRRLGEEGGQQAADPGRVPVGLGVGDRLLAQEVDGEGACPPATAGAARPTASAGPGADDELLRHPGDVAAGDGGRRRLAEGDVVGHVEAEVEHLGDVGPLEVLVQVTHDVGVAGGGREDVDEAEELGLERRVRHRPLEHALGPPRRLDHARLVVAGQLGQLVGDGRRGAVERRRHAPNVRQRGGLRYAVGNASGMTAGGVPMTIAISRLSRSLRPVRLSVSVGTGLPST